MTPTAEAFFFNFAQRIHNHHIVCNFSSSNLDGLTKKTNVRISTKLLVDINISSFKYIGLDRLIESELETHYY